MKISESGLTLFITVFVGVVLLGLQKPVTNALVLNKEKIDAKFSALYQIKNRFTLPRILNEVSGITWLENSIFACVQDEDGIIYIYDTNKNKIIEEIKFAEAGDYEGIAVNENNAYVMRSDGLLFEMLNYRSKEKTILEFQTTFKAEHNIESLTFDTKNNQLLTTPKDIDLDDKDFVNIYSISKDSKKMSPNPIASIDLKSDLLKTFRKKKIEKTLNPSDIAVHPKTGDIYILEGKKPKLIILNNKGKLLKALPLDERVFAQPEGLTFSNDGKLFISNEATDNNANILEVSLNKI